MVETAVRISLVGCILLALLAGIGFALPQITAQQGEAAAFTWDYQVRDHGDIKHGDDAPLLDECKNDPATRIFYAVTRWDKRGLPIKYNRICLRFTPQGMITLFEIFVRNGGVFERVTYYHQDMITTYEQLVAWLGKHGLELLSEAQFIALLGGGK